MVGALLEVEVGKICTTPARENDLEVKIVKTPGSRTTFWGSKCFSRGRRRDFESFQNVWQAQEFVRVAKTLAGVVDLKRLRNDAFRVAGAMISCFVMSMFEASDAESVERLQISCHWSVTLQWSFRVAVTGLRMPRLYFFVAQYFWSIHLKIAQTYWNSEVKWPVNMWFLKEVSQKCFVFDLQSFIFEGNLAEKLRFLASKLHFWRKSRRKASFLIFKVSFLKEVSHKSFVFELPSFIFEGTLVEKLRFWSSKLRFWRNSRTKASFLSFQASFLKEVSQKCFVFDLQSFVFEGSFAEQLQSVSQSVS